MCSVVSAPECMILRPNGPGSDYTQGLELLKNAWTAWVLLGDSILLHSVAFRAVLTQGTARLVTGNSSGSLVLETSPLPAGTETCPQLEKHVRQCDRDLPRTVLEHFCSLRKMAELCLCKVKGTEGSIFMEGERDSRRST